MIDAVRAGKNRTCFGISNLSNFVVVKSFRKFGGCLVDDNTYLLKASFKSFVFNFIQTPMEFFKIMFGIGGSDKCGAILFSV